MRILTLIFLSFFGYNVQAQNLTGTWEGVMGHELLQVNIKDVNGKLCGYTYDYFLNDKTQFCRAYFSGKYYPERRVWVLNGTGFIQNSGSHVLMRIILYVEKINGAVRMMAAVGAGSFEGVGERVQLKKVASSPQPLSGLPVCMPQEKPVPRVVPRAIPPAKTPPSAVKTPVPSTKKPVPPVSKPTPKVVTKPKTPESKPPVSTQRKDSARKVIPIKQPIAQKPPENVTARKRGKQNSITVNVRTIKLDVYDNGIIDGDTVSIFFNGKLLVNKKVLSAKPLSFTLELNEDSDNEVVMFAENLGSIPPNTALIVVTAGDKRHELHASASLQENAILLFKYEPR
jgi:hypothetical protein